jgi:hypothetical protein
MKAYFVPAQSQVYPNLQEVLTATVKSMVGYYDKQISDPVIQAKGGWSSSKQYFIKVAVYHDGRLVVRRRTVKIIEISASEVPTTTRFLGAEI